MSTLFIAPPEPEPLPTVLPENTIVWRRKEGESVEDAAKRYHVQATACTVSDQHQWRCSCGDSGAWTADREAALHSGGAHVLDRGHWGQVWLEVVGAFSGGGNTAVTVSVGSVGDPLPDISVFEGATMFRGSSTNIAEIFTSESVVGIDHAVGPDRTVVATYDPPPFRSEPERWLPRVEESLERITRLIDRGLPMKVRDVLDRLGLLLRAPRGRRSRQNRSARDRGARRLAARSGHAPAPSPPMSFTLGGRP